MTGAQQIAEKARNQGRVEGRVEGRAELVLRLLTLRFGPPPEHAMDRVRQASADELGEFAERVLSAATLDDVLR